MAGVLIAALAVGGGGTVCAQTPQPARLQNWVTDPQHVLSDEELAALSQRLQTLSQTLPGQPQIVIDLPTTVEDIDSYTNDIFHASGLGRKGVDNGVLIVLAIAQRQSRIEVGYGLEGVLTDLQSSGILRAARPNLQAGNYAAALNGIVSGVAGILKNAEDDGPALPAVDAQTDAWEGVGGVVVAVLLLVVLPYLLIRRARKQAVQRPGYVTPQTQATGMGWDFWLSIILNILSVLLQSRGGGGSGGSGGGGFRSGGGDSGGGGARDNW